MKDAYRPDDGRTPEEIKQERKNAVWAIFGMFGIGCIMAVCIWLT
jgi:hypothetical protein